MGIDTIYLWFTANHLKIALYSSDYRYYQNQKYN